MTLQYAYVDGKGEHDIIVYALSTCGWCKRTLNLLNELNVSYNFIYVDELEGELQSEAIAEIKKYNPVPSFPTLIIDNVPIIGFDKEKISGALQ